MDSSYMIALHPAKKMATHWEVVGKTAKKPTKNASKTSSKYQTKTFIESMPRIERNAPLKESSTIYDAFTERDRTSEQSKPVTTEHMNGSANSKRPAAASKSKKPQSQLKKHHTPKITLEQGMKLINTNEIESLLANDMSTFPESPSIWLKDLASFINLKLEDVKADDPAFEGKPTEYPQNLLPESCKKAFRKILKQAPTAVLELFFEHCVKSVIADVGNDLSLYGFQIFIQLVAFNHPQIVVKNLSQYLDLIKLHKNRPLRCLSILWCIGQCGANDLSAGLRVWLDVMLPVLGLRSLTAYSVGYLERLLIHHKDLKKAYSSVTFRDFFPVLDVVHSGTNTLPTQLQKQLRGIYPKFKEIAFGDNQENTLHDFFPSFLARLKPDGYTPFREELLSCLIVCLEKDKQCFSLWRQMYLKHLPESGVLLEHILDNWDTVNSTKINKVLLRDTIRAFDITNDGIIYDKDEPEGFIVCSVTCKEIISKKLCGFRFPWGSLFLAVFGVVIALLAYDFLINNGFKGSRTYRILEDTGVLAFSIQVIALTKLYSLKVYDWLNENVPVYYSRAVEISYPYLLLIWAKLGVFLTSLMDTLQPVIDNVKEKSPELVTWVKDNFPYDLFETVAAYVVAGWEIFLQYSYLLWQTVVFYMRIIWLWLLENVFVGKLSPENLQQFLSQSLVTIQEHLSTFVLWCNNMITTRGSN
ncbi:transmembrane protein 214-B-like [Tubulanus polymorphus]|uniref:transmembrane protein 214-B-like n=1 Tax=Tubulanus polymorphus TaxID=672921 RepID=UPI003DA54517